MHLHQLAPLIPIGLAIFLLGSANVGADDRHLLATIDAPALRAASVAYADFRARIPSEDHVVPGVGAFLREEKNYFAEVWKSPTGYEVNFIPRGSPDLEEFRGGGYQYMLDEESYEIRASGRMK